MTYAAYALFAIALLSWVGVVLFAWTITGEQDDRTATLQALQDSSSAQAVNQREHGLLSDTVAERSALDTFLNVDVISVASMISSVGKSAGVNMQLSNALSENAPASQPPTGLPVNAVGFSIDARGQFSRLMRAAQLFETLPLPSSVERFDLERTSGTGGSAPSDSWHMSLFIRVLTTTAISS